MAKVLWLAWTLWSPAARLGSVADGKSRLLLIQGDEETRVSESRMPASSSGRAANTECSESISIGVTLRRDAKAR